MKKKFFGFTLSYLDLIKIIAFVIGFIDGVIWLAWGFCFFIYSVHFFMGKEISSGVLLPFWSSANYNLN